MIRKVFVSVSFAIVVSLLVYGCATVQDTSPTGNTGTITGFVYDPAASYIAAGDLVPISGALVRVDDVIVITEADGSFTLTDIPPGRVIITATKEGHSSLSLYVDRAEVSLFLYQSGYTKPRGTASAWGQITGAPTSATSSILATTLYGDASSQNNSGKDTFSYDSSTSNYLMTGIPDDGTTYVSVDYYGDDWSWVTAYNRIETSPGASIEADLAFGSNSLGGTVSVPSGMAPYYLNVCIYNDKKYGIYLTGRSLYESETFEAGSLPGLREGDSYVLDVSASATDESITKYFYAVSGASINADIADVPRINFIDPTPAASALTASNPTFAWNAVSGEDVFYQLYIYDQNDHSQVFNVLTDATSVILPDYIVLNPAGEYDVYLYACSMPGFDVARYETVVNSYPNFAARASRKYNAGISSALKGGKIKDFWPLGRGF